MSVMSVLELKRVCREHGLYSTPELNDKLYLHYKGYCKIENLEAYSDVKVLYLEGNGFVQIEGVNTLKQLRCLYLQENLLTTIENLAGCEQLHTLNLNQNQIAGIDDDVLRAHPHLHTLMLAKNRLSLACHLQALTTAPELSVVDLSSNNIGDVGILDVLAAMPALKVLYLKDNPVVSAIKNYRKTVISRCRQLTYLDDRPVDEEERRCVNAWAEGGIDAEKAERTKIKEEKEEKQRRNFMQFEEMLAIARRDADFNTTEQQQPPEQQNENCEQQW
jgi:dynein assembly factor 1